MNVLIHASPGQESNRRCKISIIFAYAVIIGVVLYGLNWYDIMHTYKPEVWMPPYRVCILW